MQHLERSVVSFYMEWNMELGCMCGIWLPHSVKFRTAFSNSCSIFWYSGAGTDWVESGLLPNWSWQWSGALKHLLSLKAVHLEKWGDLIFREGFLSESGALPLSGGANLASGDCMLSNATPTAFCQIALMPSGQFTFKVNVNVNLGWWNSCLPSCWFTSFFLWRKCSWRNCGTYW